jgi:hypothetical protein
MLEMDNLDKAVARASINRSRLVFLSTTQVAQAKQYMFASLDLNYALSAPLTNTPKQDRPKLVGQLIAALINDVHGERILITGLEILFDRSLAVDPIRLLSTCAKNKTLLVSWPGDKTSSGLSYAAPSHPEHRTYKASDLSDVIFLTADTQLHLRDVNEIR